MAGELKIFSIYKIQNEDKFYLLRTKRPSFSNASQTQEILADKIEQNKREYILDLIRKTYEQISKTDFEFIGELQMCPIGDKLYLDKGNLELNIFFLETEYGQPWIIIGNANSETEFLTELNDDEDLLELEPVGQPKRIKATFVIEEDFDLPEIENNLATDV